LTKEFQPKSLRQRALDYLGKREYSYAELSQKLKAFLAEDEDACTITEILDDFKKRGWLSDARFTEQIVHARSHKFGANKIANELREKGVAMTWFEMRLKKSKRTNWKMHAKFGAKNLMRRQPVVMNGQDKQDFYKAEGLVLM
jgi:SOS response regulatory protein OraA/RecX